MHVWMGAGTGFRDDGAARAFFAVGRQYRARGFVATSYNKYTAQDFIKRVRAHLRPFPLTPVPTYARSHLGSFPLTPVPT